MSRAHADAPGAPWPSPMDAAAFRGLAGEFVAMVEAHSEASREALLVQFVAAFGSVVGRTAFYEVGATPHHANLFVALVGKTSRARKQTSWDYVEKLFSHVDPRWFRECKHSGLSSGEGLIHAIRDADDAKGDYGVVDKRLLAFEPELGQVFKVFRREANTLSTTLRTAWDGKRLQTLAKNCGEVASDPHVSLVGHITRGELLRCIADVELLNGLANRFLWVCVERSKVLPWSATGIDEHLAAFAPRVVDAVGRARCAGRLVFANDARPAWESAYGELTTSPNYGVVEGVVSRAEAQTVRLASAYALLDGDNVIQRPHLEAALAVWRYSEASAQHIFGESTGDKRADQILAALRREPDGLSLTALHRRFGNNLTSDALRTSLFLLFDRGLVTQDQGAFEGRGGRRAEVWRLKRTNETKDTKELAGESTPARNGSSDSFRSHHQGGEAAQPPSGCNDAATMHALLDTDVKSC